MSKTEQLPDVGIAHVELECTRLYAGDTLRGMVRAKLDKPVTDAMISVQITGRQRLQWVNVAQSFEKRYHTKTHDHLSAELFLGGLNTSLAAGHHEFPFELPLPADLIPNAHIRSIHRLFVFDMRNVYMDIKYTVSAGIESAGLTNQKLQSEVEFSIGTTPAAIPVTPIRAGCVDNVKRLGVGHGQPCTLHMMSEKGVFELPTGLVDVVVEVDLPPKRTLKTVELFLYENVCVDRGDGEKDGRYREDERVVCSQTFESTAFMVVDGSPNTRRAKLEMRIDDPRMKAAGGAVAASLESVFLQFRHRIAVEASFGMGSVVEVSAPVRLVYAVPVAVPVEPDQAPTTP